MYFAPYVIHGTDAEKIPARYFPHRRKILQLQKAYLRGKQTGNQGI